LEINNYTLGNKEQNIIGHPGTTKNYGTYVELIFLNEGTKSIHRGTKTKDITVHLGTKRIVKLIFKKRGTNLSERRNK
jgi:hypothetical protein